MSRTNWFIPVNLACAAAFLLGGCEDGSDSLDLSALRPAEIRYVERYVVLERARAVALADPEAGAAILDSLAAAWGDTAGSLAEAALPADGHRAARLHDLLARMLAAEADSLIHAPHPRRLSAPLPEPLPQTAP